MGTTWNLHNKYGGKGYQYMEESCCLRYQWYWKHVTNALMINTTRSSKNHIEHAQAFKMELQYFSAHDNGGKFHFNKTPLEPLGTNIILHKKPNIRHTWGQHGLQGWYIGPVVEHYQFYKVYIYNIRWERIKKKVKLFPDNTTMPGIYSTNEATHTVTEMTIALKNPALADLFSPLGTYQLMHLEN